MQGSVFISHKNGFACSNDVLFDIERDRVEHEGKPAMKHTSVLKVKGMFGALEVGTDVDCVFKRDDNEHLQAFVGIVSGKTNLTHAIRLTAKTERTKEILNKIKEEINA